MDITEKISATLPISVTATNVEPTSKSAIITLKRLQNENDWNQAVADAAGNAAVTFAQTWTNIVIPWADSEIARLTSVVAERERALDLLKSDLKSDNKKRRKMARDTADTIENQISTAERNIKEVKNEKKETQQKIEDFLLEVYALKFMDESVTFLRMLKDSNVTLSKDTEIKLFGRLFFIGNAYREDFTKFEQIITESKDKYSEAAFYAEADGLHYFAKRTVQNENLNGSIKIACDSEEASKATLSYKGENLFSIPKKSVEAAKTAIESICKNYVLEQKKSSFIVSLNKVVENGDIAAELDSLTANSDAYTEELSAIISAALANGGKLTFFQKLKAASRNRKAEKAEKALKKRNRNAEERNADNKKEKNKVIKKLLIMMLVVIIGIVWAMFKLSH